MRFDGRSGVRGYDPEKHLAMYEAGDPGSERWQDKLNGMRRADYDRRKGEINEQKRIAYHARRERET